MSELTGADAQMSVPNHVWVDDQEGLMRAVEDLSGRPALAVDTEADSFYHYFHKCCLIQISDGEVAYLIDPLAIDRLDALGALMSSKSIVKVLHAAEQDVMYLRRDFGFVLHSVFDTMIGAQLLGLPGIGLARLLETYFGVRLDKGCQRDDWSRRPLSDRQKSYAADDVRRLIALKAVLTEALHAKGRMSWAEEEFDLVAQRSWDSRPFDADDVWGIKGVRDLSPRQAAVLRRLFVMRDERARQADLPPFRIVSDEALLALARRLPVSAAELHGIKGVTPLVRRRIGDGLLEAVRLGHDDPEATPPVSSRSGRGRRKPAAAVARLLRLREWRSGEAARLGLDPGVLMPQSTLEGLALRGLAAIDAPDGIVGMRRWRLDLIRPVAAQLLS